MSLSDSQFYSITTGKSRQQEEPEAGAHVHSQDRDNACTQANVQLTFSISSSPGAKAQGILGLIFLHQLREIR